MSHYEQSGLQSLARTMSEMDIVNQTDVNDDMNTHLPESSAPMLKSPTIFERLYVNSSALPTLNPGIINQMDVTLDMDTDPPENSAPMINSDLMIVDWEDIFCSRPRYCGKDLHGMMDTDMCRTVAQNHRRSDADDNSDTDSVAELEYSAWDDACAGEFQNTLGNIPPGLVQNPPTDKIRNYETDDNRDTDSVAELEYSAWDDACAGEFQNTIGNIPPGLVQNPPTYKIQNYETDDYSDTDSVAELEYKTWEDACVRECWSALVNIPPGLVQNPPTDKIRNYETDDNSDTDSVVELGDYIGDDTCALECRIALLRFSQNPPTDIWYPKLMNCHQTEDMDCMPHVVCYDCICFMP